jgi:hypothetical protein
MERELNNIFEEWRHLFSGYKLGVVSEDLFFDVGDGRSYEITKQYRPSQQFRVCTLDENNMPLRTVVVGESLTGEDALLVGGFIESVKANKMTPMIWGTHCSVG